MDGADGTPLQRTSSAPRRAWLAATALLVSVTALMLWPLRPSGLGPSWPHLDKLVHFGAWLIMAVVFWRAWSSTRSGRSRGFRALVIIGALTAWGIAVELLQLLIPYRSGNVWDGVADALGAIAGVAIMAALEGEER